MAFTPTAGQFAVLKITPSGGAQSTQPAINWKIGHDGKLKDVSNFRDGRVQAKTLPISTLAATLVWDSAANPTLAANGQIQPGQNIVANCYTDPATTKPIVFTGMIATVNPGNEGVEGVVMIDFTATESGGALAYPNT